jgi:hypothetical protein
MRKPADRSRRLPRPLTIPKVMTLTTLADVRRLIEHVPADRRKLQTWRHVAGQITAAAWGTVDVADAIIALAHGAVYGRRRVPAKVTPRPPTKLPKQIGGRFMWTLVLFTLFGNPNTGGGTAANVTTTLHSLPKKLASRRQKSWKVRAYLLIQRRHLIRSSASAFLKGGAIPAADVDADFES